MEHPSSVCHPFMFEDASLTLSKMHLHLSIHISIDKGLLLANLNTIITSPYMQYVIKDMEMVYKV